MTPLRPQLRGLMSKLALFYILLSLPTLILVESTVLIFEFQEFMAGVEQGRLRDAAERGAADLAQHWHDPDAHARTLEGSQGEVAADVGGFDPASNGFDRTFLRLFAESWILRLERPRDGLSAENSYVLLELSADPLAAAVLAPDGRVLAQAPRDASWQPTLPRVDEAGFAEAVAGRTASELVGEDSPYKIRRVLAPVRAADGELLGLLYVELRLPLPWRKFLLELSFEWPIVLGYLIVFGLASSFFFAAWVTRRLNHIARAATAWSRGNFSDRINDRSRDELGIVSGLLDRMALELRGLMRSRAQLATLAERQRLARELHDTVKQKAFALNLQLATARRVLGNAPGAERLEPAQRLIQQIQQELGQILDELRVADADLPLAERVRTRANEWAHTSGMSLGFALNDVPALAAATEEALLRIVDEALSNVLRHSGADHVELTLRREAERVQLVIADNGRGARDESAPGMGLRNMRERVQALPGGRFGFDTSLGGTRVTASFIAAETPDS